MGESNIPLCTSSGRKLLLRPSSSYNELLGRVGFRNLLNILSKIQDGAVLPKQPIALHVDYICKKISPQMFDWIPNASPVGGTVNVSRLYVPGICNCRLVYKTNRTNPHPPRLKAPQQEKINKIILPFSNSQVSHPKFSVSKLIHKQVLHPSSNYTWTSSVGVLNKNHKISCHLCF